MTYAVLRNEKLLGASAVAREGATGTRVWISGKTTKRLLCNDAGLFVADLTLGGGPGQIVFERTGTVYLPGDAVTMPTTAWTVCDDGKLYNCSSTAILATLDIKATEGWLTASGGYMIAPGPPGTIVVLTGAGVEIARRFILDRVAWAVGSSGGRVYCFDGAGAGVTVTIGAGGVPVMGERFKATSCVSIQDAIVSGSSLIVAAGAMDNLVTLSLTDADNPVIASTSRSSRGKGLTGAASATRQTTTDDNAQFYDGDRWLPLAGGRLVGSNFYLAGPSALVTDD